MWVQTTTTIKDGVNGTMKVCMSPFSEIELTSYVVQCLENLTVFLISLHNILYFAAVWEWRAHLCSCRYILDTEVREWQGNGYTMG